MQSFGTPDPNNNLNHMQNSSRFNQNPIETRFGASNTMLHRKRSSKDDFDNSSPDFKKNFIFSQAKNNRKDSN